MAEKRKMKSGLAELFGDAAIESGSKTEQEELALDQIMPNPDQPRSSFNEEALGDLADSIKKEGLLQPILVRPRGGKYEIVAGERRYQASKIAGLKSIPVRIVSMDDAQTLRVALIENLQRSDLNAIEEARGYRELMKKDNLTQSEVAEAVSKSRPAIANALRLLDLPEAIQEMIYEGKVTAGHARAILSVPDETSRMKLASKIAEDKISVREAENIARLYAAGELERAKRPATPRSFKVVAKELRKRLDAPVRVKNTRGKNKIEIEFQDEGDLQRIFSLLKGVPDQQ